MPRLRSRVRVSFPAPNSQQKREAKLPFFVSGACCRFPVTTQGLTNGRQAGVSAAASYGFAYDL
ncbi:hypothetical protein THICB2_30001 [Thiomonas sp. CB2]|nr:hypothetical protein THICB2_30001 [Thiomonas sp. CB2]